MRIPSAAPLFNLSSLRKSDLSVSLDEAVRIFDTLADIDYFSFNYPQDGCYARAHAMCDELVEMGLSPWKAWAVEGKNGYLQLRLPGREAIYWGYHVAPAIFVQSGKEGGKAALMVLDPAIFDGPVTPERWGEAIGAAPDDNLFLVPRDDAPPGSKSAYMYSDHELHLAVDAHAEETLERYSQWQSKGQRSVLPSPERHSVSARTAGITWITAEPPAEPKARWPFSLSKSRRPP